MKTAPTGSTTSSPTTGPSSTVSRVDLPAPVALGIGDEIRIGSTELTVGFTDRAPRTRSKRNPLLVGAGAIGLVLVGFLLAQAGSDEPKSTSELVAEARPSTVLVVSKIDGQRVGNGTGWVYDAEEGLIVTNSHVIDGAEQFEIGVDGDPDLRKATISGVAPCDDLAVLKVSDTTDLKTLPLGSQSEIEQGDRLLTLGYPGNGTTEDELQVTDGVVSVVRTTADEDAFTDPDFSVYPNVIQTDAAINAGNSGGPSISEDGELIGVNTLGSIKAQNQNFAIGVDRVKELAPTLASGESIGWAGFGFIALPPGQLAGAGVPDLGGGALLVTSVVPGTGAAKERIFVDDLITFVNREFVENRRQYCAAVRGVESGEVVPIEVADSVTDYSDFYNLKVPFE